MIDITKSKQYTLSIRLSTDGFSFFIYNPIEENPYTIINKQPDPSTSMTANLRKIFQECDFLNCPYKRVNALTVTRRYTIVPAELFDEKQAETLFHYNHPKLENEKLLYNILPANNIAILFGINNSVHSFLNEQYPDIRLYPQITPYIEYFSTRSRLGNSRKMYVAFRHGTIDIFCFEHGQLLLANSFEYNQTEDCIYYLLYAWKQLELDQERDELHLTGVSDEKDAILEKLRAFIRHIFIMNPTSNIDIEALLTCE